MEKNDLLKRTRSKEDERTVLVSLTKKAQDIKQGAASIPQNLLNTLTNDDVEISDVILLKKTLDSWIEILSQNSENLSTETKK